MILKNPLILLFPNDTEKKINLVFSHSRQVVLSLLATVKAHLIWYFARNNNNRDVSF